MEPRATSATPPTERQLLDDLRETLAETLPADWRVALQAAPRYADATLVLTAPDGRTAELLVEAKSLVNARDIPAIRAQLGLLDGESDTWALVASRYLSPRAREVLASTGVSYADATGNLRLQLSEPGLFLLREGASSDPWRTPDRPTNSLRGKPAARVVRALVDLGRTWRIRELAQVAGTSLGSTSRTVDFLEREALIERDDAGSITGVDWPALIDRWAADYDLAKKRRVLRLLTPRGAASIEEGLREWSGRYVISGSLAADQWAPYAESRLALVYTDDADTLAAELGLREAPTRPNVLLVEPDDDYVFLRPVEQDALRFAAPAQVAVDLLAGPGRSPDEGKALIRWMQANEPAWRGS